MKIRRAIIAILCVVCLAFGMVACGDPGEADGSQVTYSVTVTGDTIFGLSSATVQLFNENGEAATEEKHLTLNNDATAGTATFKLKEGRYTVVVDGDFDGKIPTGNMQLTATVRKTTIELKKESDIPPTGNTYRVRFILPDNTPVKGLTAQICSDKNCYENRTPSDENGWATWDVATDNYEVHVLEEDWPEGYYFDNSAFTLNATKREVVAKFIAFVEHTVNVNYAATEYNKDFDRDVYVPGGAASGVRLNVYEMNPNTMEATDALVATVTTDAAGVAKFFAKQVDLIVIATPPAGYAINAADSKILEKPYNNKAPTPLQILLYKEGNDAYTGIKITPSDEPNTVNVTKDSPSLYYEFTPTESGIYEVTSTSTTLNTYLNLYASNSGYVGNADMRSEDPHAYQKYGNNFTLTLSVSKLYIGDSNRWVFRIGAENVTANGSFTFTLKRVGDYAEIEMPDLVNVEPKSIIDAAEMNKIMADIDDESAFTFIAYDPTDPDIIVKGDSDDYYHYSSPDGPIVFASLGDKYIPAGFSGGGFNSAVTNPESLGWTLSDGKTYNEYYRDFVDDYCKNLNADGLHPLNDELKTFLTRYGVNMRRDDEFYYACGYYKGRYAQLIGEGDVIATNDYKITVKAGETRTLTYITLNDVQSFDGVVSIVSGNVKLLDGKGAEVAEALVVANNDAFSLKNDGSADVAVVIHVEFKTADSNITAPGNYVVKASPEGTEYTFTAVEAGVYSFTFDKENYMLGIDGEMYDEVQLTAGQTVTLTVYPPYGVNEESIVTLTIAKTEAAA